MSSFGPFHQVFQRFRSLRALNRFAKPKRRRLPSSRLFPVAEKLEDRTLLSTVSGWDDDRCPNSGSETFKPDSAALVTFNESDASRPSDAFDPPAEPGNKELTLHGENEMPGLAQAPVASEQLHVRTAKQAVAPSCLAGLEPDSGRDVLTSDEQIADDQDAGLETSGSLFASHQLLADAIDEMSMCEFLLVNDQGEPQNMDACAESHQQPLAADCDQDARNDPGQSEVTAALTTVKEPREFARGNDTLLDRQSVQSTVLLDAVSAPDTAAVVEGTAVNLVDEVSGDLLARGPPESVSHASLPGTVHGRHIHLTPSEAMLLEDVLILEASDLLSGGGQDLRSVINRGVVSPGNSPEILNVATFTQEAPGTLVIEIGGLTPGPGPAGDENNGYDQVNVSGLAQLGGTIQISLINNFTPTLGQTFEFMTFASLDPAAADFADFSGLWIGDGLYFQPVLSATNYVLQVAKAPGDVADIATDTAAMLDDLMMVIADKSSGPVTVSGSLEFAGFVTASGSLSFQRNGTSIQAAASNVTAKLTAGSYEAGVTNATLGVVLNSDGTRAIYATGDILYAGPDFASITATAPSILFNDTATDYSITPLDLDVGGITARIATGLGTQSVSLEGLSFSITDFVSISGDFGFGLDLSGPSAKILAGATNVNAFLGAGGIGVEVTGASLGLALYGSGGYALSASGDVALTGIDALTLNGSLAVQVNATGRAVNETISTGNGNAT